MAAKSKAMVKLSSVTPNHIYVFILSIKTLWKYLQLWKRIYLSYTKESRDRKYSSGFLAVKS